MARDSREVIKCWEEGKTLYVFLPSYADLSNTEVVLRTQKKCELGGRKLSDGISCEAFELDVDYELILEGYGKRKLRFVRSANVATMFVNTFSNTMEYLHANKEHKEQVMLTVYSSEGRVDYQGEDGDKIGGHGNSTWQYYEKKPYNLYLKQEANLLGMEPSDKWVLLANALDESNLRSKLAYDFANELNNTAKWAPESDYVDLYVNGEYRGLYLLSEKMEKVARRLLPNAENTLFQLNDQESKLDHPRQAILLNDSPLYAEIAFGGTNAEYAQLEGFLRSLEGNLATEAWKDCVDVDAFARRYLIDEIFANTDGGIASQYYFWDHEEDRLCEGPLWDYDSTFGDDTWMKGIVPNSLFIEDRYPFHELFQHGEFREYVERIYQTECLPRLNALLEEGIPAISQRIEKAVANNSLRWNSLYTDKESDVASLTSFFSARVTFLNSAWIDDDPYCKVTFQAEGCYNPIIPRQVPKGSLCQSLPTAGELGIEGYEAWRNLDTGELLDGNAPITEDIVLHTQKKAKRPAKLYYLAAGIFLIFCLMLMTLIFIDARRERRLA
ncbi:MAG: CotH kinase family protein [Lachnospiraceae bacterium]|nr:CotH kinase family protein [Lachnospiraceae bacterium]